MQARGSESNAQPKDPNEPHPIVGIAVFNIEVGPKGKGWVFPEAARTRVQQSLEQLFESNELRHAVISLVSLAKHFDDRGQRLVAADLLAIASTATQALIAQGSESAKLAQDLGTMTTAVFTAFTATEVTRAAPALKSSKYGLTAKPGTIAIGSINSLRKRRA